MRLLRETIELRADTELEAKEIIENYQKKASEEGYTISTAGYAYKIKKSKSNIIDEAWVCEIVMNFSGVWEE